MIRDDVHQALLEERNDEDAGGTPCPGATWFVVTCLVTGISGLGLSSRGDDDGIASALRWVRLKGCCAEHVL